MEIKVNQYNDIKIKKLMDFLAEGVANSIDYTQFR